MFLMHRVELKVFSEYLLNAKAVGFLMHRVELKDFYGSSRPSPSPRVPNAPCGVESDFVVAAFFVNHFSS